MVSQTAEYALRALVWLAYRTGEQFTTVQIAKGTRVPAGYLSKVLQSLARAGLVKSQRGLGGGFILNHAPDDINLWDVVNAVDPIKRIHTCPLGITTHGVNLCPLHRKVDDAIALIEKEFKNTSLAEVLEPKSGSAPLCEFPMPTKGATAVSLGRPKGRRGAAKSRKSKTSKRG